MQTLRLSAYSIAVGAVLIAVTRCTTDPSPTDLSPTDPSPAPPRRVDVGPVENLRDAESAVDAITDSSSVDSTTTSDSSIPGDADTARMPCWQSLLRPAPTTIVSVASFGANPDDGIDDTSALRTAFAAANSGKTLRFAPGVYTYSDSMFVDAAGMDIDGNGATLEYRPTAAALVEACPSPVGVGNQRCCPTNGTRKADGTPPLQYPTTSLFVRAKNVSLHDLRLTSTVPNQPYRRACSGLHYRIYVERGDGVQLYRNEIIGSPAAGILLGETKGFVIAGNRVIRTNSDGIHAASGSTDGIIVNNVVKETGDDTIAIVSYRDGDGTPRCRNILIQDNDVDGAFWGRGITVVGGEQITIRNNRIRNIQMAAGILIHRENSYNTWGVRNVLVEGNQIFKTQTDPPTYDPRGDSDKKSGHYAIDVDGQGVTAANEGDLGIRDIVFRNNTVNESRFGGVSIRGGACKLHLDANRFDQLGGPVSRVINVVPNSNCRPLCTGNLVNGNADALVGCGSDKGEATGAILRCQ
jgi:hypothetical protein